MKSVFAVYLLALAAIVVLGQTARGQDRPATAAATQADTAFTGDHSDWHGFDRYDFMLDENNLAIVPADPKIKGDVNAQRRCIVVVPKNAAPGNPWAWRGCYWDYAADGNRIAQARFSHRLHYCRRQSPAG